MIYLISFFVALTTYRVCEIAVRDRRLPPSETATARLLARPWARFRAHLSATWRWANADRPGAHTDALATKRRACGHLDRSRYCDECVGEIREIIKHQPGCGDYHPCSCEPDPPEERLS